jgi:hypothetical protein
MKAKCLFYKVFDQGAQEISSTASGADPLTDALL